jgi:negative regulator of flagellin synthesis FlgM
VSNKINDLTSNVTAGQSSAAAAVAPARDAGTGTAAASPAPTGEVHITDTATQLAALEQGLRASPAVDAARVAQLRGAIEQGSYTVDPQQVATQLVAVERALGNLGNEE